MVHLWILKTFLNIYFFYVFSSTKLSTFTFSPTSFWFIPFCLTIMLEYLRILVSEYISEYSLHNNNNKKSSFISCWEHSDRILCDNYSKPLICCGYLDSFLYINYNLAKTRSNFFPQNFKHIILLSFFI